MGLAKFSSFPSLWCGHLPFACQHSCKNTLACAFATGQMSIVKRQLSRLKHANCDEIRDVLRTKHVNVERREELEKSIGQSEAFVILTRKSGESSSPFTFTPSQNTGNKFKTIIPRISFQIYNFQKYPSTSITIAFPANKFVNSKQQLGTSCKFFSNKWAQVRENFRGSGERF